MSAEPRAARFGPWRREASAFFELFALTGIAVAQPTYDLVGKNASELVANGRTRPQILVMTILVLLVPPVLAWVFEAAVGLVFPAARRYVHAAIAAVIVGTIVVEALKKQTGWSTLILIGAAVVIGILGGLVVLRFDVARLFLRYLAFAPVIFAIMFVFVSPASKVIFPSDVAAADVKVGNPSRVVLIVMDEFPVQSLLDGKGAIDPQLFPNFAALAAGSSWYRNATTVSPFTQTAVPAILTGDLPEDGDAIPVASEYPDNLFTLLSGNYTMNVHETMTQLCPTDLCPRHSNAGNRRGLVGFLLDTRDLWTTFASPERLSGSEPTAAFNLNDTGRAQLADRRFVRSLKQSTSPQLDFLHLGLPHEGWHFLPTGQNDGATFESGQVLNAESRAVWAAPWLATVGRQRHLLQLQYTDAVLGRIINKLKRIGAYNDALVILTADHGVAFDPTEPVRGVSAKNASAIAWPPLFVKSPGQTTAQINDQPVQTIDLLPTIADVLDVKLPWTADGKSLFDRRRTKPSEVRIMEWSHNTLLPTDGSAFATVDGPTAFARVLAAQAAPDGGDPNLRLYRLGPYGSLVGSAAAPLVSGETRGLASVTDRAKFDAVDPQATYVPWCWITGTLEGIDAGQSIAVTVNGVVAGLSEAYPGTTGGTRYWASLPPQMFRAGANEIALYRVDGDPSSPRLTPIQLQP